MPIPVHISFRDMEPTPALEKFIRNWVIRLERAYERIEQCDVVIERPHQHRRHGRPVRVRVVVAVPGPDIVVSRDHSLDDSHMDVYVAIRDAFRAARRQLEDRARRKREVVAAP